MHYSGHASQKSILFWCLKLQPIVIAPVVWLARKQSARRAAYEGSSSLYEICNVQYAVGERVDIYCLIYDDIVGRHCSSSWHDSAMCWQWPTGRSRSHCAEPSWWIPQTKILVVLVCPRNGVSTTDTLFPPLPRPLDPGASFPACNIQRGGI